MVMRRVKLLGLLRRNPVCIKYTFGKKLMCFVQFFYKFGGCEENIVINCKVEENLRIKGNIAVISSDPPFKEDHLQFIL